MSLLYIELKNIYDKKAYLNRTSPLEEFHVSFKLFLINELKKKTRYFNPYKFAAMYAIKPREALNIFLALSVDNKVLQKYFAIECECGGIRIIGTLEEEIFCDECYEEIPFNKEYFLENITILFKLEHKIKKELEFNLKHQSSSANSKIVKEEEILRGPSFDDILATQKEDEGLDEILGMKEFAERMRNNLNLGA